MRIESRDVTEDLVSDNDEVKYVPYRKVLSPNEENGNYRALATEATVRWVHLDRHGVGHQCRTSFGAAPFLL